MSILYLVRHGQASFGTHDYDRLSALGVRQVELLRDHLRSLEDAPHAIYSGSLKRQQHTARILADGAEDTIITLPAFDEYGAGSLIRAHAAQTGVTLPEPGGEAPVDPRAFQRRLEEVGVLWADGALQAPGIEPWERFSGRVAEGLRELMAREGRSRRVYVSTSAGVIGAAVGALLGLAPREAVKLSWSVHNSSLTRIQFDGRRTSLLSFNAAPHLEHPDRRPMLTFR
ncbi:MAG: histidine phosphatase family protein [Gammaproteobacteria bacterium]